MTDKSGASPTLPGSSGCSRSRRLQWAWLPPAVRSGSSGGPEVLLAVVAPLRPSGSRRAVVVVMVTGTTGLGCDPHPVGDLHVDIPGDGERGHLPRRGETLEILEMPTDPPPTAAVLPWHWDAL